MSQLMAQTAKIQQQILQAQSCPRPTRNKPDPPRFECKDSDDLELWIFSTEQYYSEFQTEMHELSSSFSNMMFPNLGVDAQAWFRDVMILIGSSPLTWQLFKERVRARFRDKDFKFKTLTKMFELKPGKSQQEYTSKFLHLLSQVDINCQMLSRDAQRFEDTTPAQTRPPGKEQAKPTAKSDKKGGEKTSNDSNSSNTTVTCGNCKKKNHTEDVCRKKAHDNAASDTGS
ncbi:hypothetical protein PI124_g856 [Phytophthora idaei]|nr:hypothetical protein PI124_g856 [Phytophthora idaei]